MDMLDIKDTISLHIDNLDRASLMLVEMLNDFLSPLEMAQYKSDRQTIREMTSGSDIYAARVKCEIAADLVDRVHDSLQSLKNDISVIRHDATRKPEEITLWSRPAKAPTKTLGSIVEELLAAQVEDERFGDHGETEEA